ncbi:flagellar hook capping FlgD N-terminal domain-containing protein [Tabrizicola sp.]|uniref:flagellar hook capping FlgD N-terminal domain-containing protein n=1 Tax=Tabrizicola sp. TaxID=2005166 RepID=UPI002606906D|nr:flagellar hook capping FlgD N-terminal domain-containing protein [Tabrizicola sp.]MDM7931839.1 flagellar hook capping FlgD N-terminal domain-containing protein [Tabrizicola sp.]
MTVSAATFSASSASAASTTGQGTKITSDFNTFLRMLTVQMQNQDPLNPIDSTDYAVQLATFSGVEQQVRTNQLLSDMQARFQQMGMAEMASWIGQEARSNAPVFYDGDPVTLSPNPAQGATGAVVVVRDAQGNLVSREDLPATAAPYRWLGADAAGNRLPSGIYSLTLESLQGENLIDSRPIEHYARVIEARGGDAGTKLVLHGGVEVSASAVTALRLPQG